MFSYHLLRQEIHNCGLVQEVSRDEIKIEKIKSASMWVNDMRIKRSSLPEGKYQYEVVGDNDCRSEGVLLMDDFTLL